VSAPVGIVELVTVCRARAALDRAWFERLGRWAQDGDDGAAQRLFATACHRHAWHAELWERRVPTIPQTAVADTGAAPSPIDLDTDPATDAERLAIYASFVDGSLSTLDSLAERLDPDLDPSTARVLTLVRADLTDLRAHLPTV
jgi:hypothetical protein